MLETPGVDCVPAVPTSQISLAGPRTDVLPRRPAHRHGLRAGHRPGTGTPFLRRGRQGAERIRLDRRPVAPGGRVRPPGRRADPPTLGTGTTRPQPAARDRPPPRLHAPGLGCTPLEVSADELVRVAGFRWAIEECSQAAKNECGPDGYEVRRYVGRYLHSTLAMPARAFLAAMSARAAEEGDPPVRMPRSSRSLWRKCGDSWQLTHPNPPVPAPER